MFLKKIQKNFFWANFGQKSKISILAKIGQNCLSKIFFEFFFKVKDFLYFYSDIFALIHLFLTFLEVRILANVEFWRIFSKGSTHGKNQKILEF